MKELVLYIVLSSLHVYEANLRTNSNAHDG